MSLTVRKASPSDYQRFTELFAELATGDPIPEASRWETAMMPSTLFFESEGEVAAYAWTTTLADVGYVRHVVVAPSHRGKGHGRVVMETLRSSFQQAGCARWVLNVKPDNVPAIALYRGVGMAARYRSTAVKMEWDIVEKLPRSTREVVSERVDASEDAALEGAFGLPKGTLASSRAYPDRVVLRLRDTAVPGDLRVGLASFDPHFPGSFPFRVGEPPLARALLEAIRPHALPRFSHVGAVIEDDDALTRLLLDHGAVARLEIVHYEGKL